MPFTTDEQKELARFPVLLRALINAELAAGNTVLAFGHGHPAAPIGAYIKLVNKVSTRPRATGDGLRFREKPYSSSHSGEFTDEVGHFFVLEAPDPPPPDPDMDAIREELAERERRANADRFRYDNETPPDTDRFKVGW